MDTCTHVRGTTVPRFAPVAFPVTLAVALLAGCGDSDLPEHHRDLLAQAAAEERPGAMTVVEPGIGAANGGEPSTAEPGDGSQAPEPEDGSPSAGPDDGSTSEDGGDVTPRPGGSDNVVPIGPATEQPEPEQPEPEQPEPEEPEPEEPEPEQPEPEQPAPEPSSGGSPDGAVEGGSDGGDDSGSAGDTDGQGTTSGDTDTPAGSPDSGQDGNEDGAADGNAEGAGETDPPGSTDGGPPEPGPAPPAAATGTDPNTDGAPVEAIDLDDYELVFADEFDGDTLDASKWKTVFEYGQVAVEQELQYFIDTLGGETGFDHDPFTVAGGTLTIRAIETPESRRADANGQPWLSGMLSTAGLFDFDEGYAEIRADLPEGSGLGSMFTLIASDYAAPPRPVVTVLRHDGEDADELQHEYRYTDTDGTRLTPGAWTVADDALPTGMHTVGVSWDDEGLLFFVDGEATYRIVGDSLPSQAMYLVTSLAVGGTSRSEPDAATPRPADLVIDRIRVWKRRP